MTLEVWLEEIAGLTPQQQLNLLVAQFRHEFAVDPHELGLNVSVFSRWTSVVTFDPAICVVYAFWPTLEQWGHIPGSCLLVMQDIHKKHTLSL